MRNKLLLILYIAYLLSLISIPLTRPEAVILNYLRVRGIKFQLIILRLISILLTIVLLTIVYRQVRIINESTAIILLIIICSGTLFIKSAITNPLLMLGSIIIIKAFQSNKLKWLLIIIGYLISNELIVLIIPLMIINNSIIIPIITSILYLLLSGWQSSGLITYSLINHSLIGLILLVYGLILYWREPLSKALLVSIILSLRTPFNSLAPLTIITSWLITLTIMRINKWLAIISLIIIIINPLLMNYDNEVINELRSLKGGLLILGESDEVNCDTISYETNNSLVCNKNPLIVIIKKGVNNIDSQYYSTNYDLIKITSNWLIYEKPA